jgi:putative endonuclease
MYSTYILWSEKLQKYYVGHTDNLSRRLLEHNSGKSHFTKTGIPWIVKFEEDFESRSDAMKREQQIKDRKSKQYIQHIIE